MVQPTDVIAFWHEAGMKKWFAKDAAFDAAIRERFAAAHDAAAQGGFADWRASPEGTLALLLLLDQFSRNLFRGDARAYAADPLARAIARDALRRGFDRAGERWTRPFFYLPFEHSEALADQDRSVALFAAFGDLEGLRYADIHRDLIVRFGRFPHRNATLGRASTKAELAYLEGEGFKG